MSMLDKKKERIGVLKLWLGIVAGALLAIIGYLATNFRHLESWLIFAGSLAIVFLLVLIFLITQNLNKKIDELEDL